MNTATTQTMIVMMENEAGVLANLVGLFSQRALNIDSLTVLPTEQDKSLSKLTLTTTTEQRTLQQLSKQIARLVDVASVSLVNDQLQQSQAAA